ncbi:hypothetical protein [Bartonella sp. DGB1]|uniref:hypothetical protein n=1 Tax=Bartonella sp. DGB1 TaxID=3239807 RepID=UPI003524C292
MEPITQELVEGLTPQAIANFYGALTATKTYRTVDYSGKFISSFDVKEPFSIIKLYAFLHYSYSFFKRFFKVELFNEEFKNINGIYVVPSIYEQYKNISLEGREYLPQAIIKEFDEFNKTVDALDEKKSPIPYPKDCQWKSLKRIFLWIIYNQMSKTDEELRIKLSRKVN